MSPEEIEAMEASIPEWKRNALVVGDDEVKTEEARGILGKLKSKVNETEAAKKFYESDEG
jgi:hypothetical protein